MCNQCKRLLRSTFNTTSIIVTNNTRLIQTTFEQINKLLFVFLVGIMYFF